MATVVKTHAFPVAYELFDPILSRASKTSLHIPRSAKSSPLLNMLAILICFVAGLYAAVQIYGCAFRLLDSQLPKVFAYSFGAAYLFQLFVGYLQHKEEKNWRKTLTKQTRI